MIRRVQQVLWTSIFLCAAGRAQSTTPAIQVPVAGNSGAQVFATASTIDGSAATVDSSLLSVFLDKRQAQVLSSRPARDDKLLFAVVVDISASDAPKAQSIKDAAVQLFQGLSNDRSQGYLVLLNREVVVSDRPLQASEVQATLDKTSFTGGTALFDGIDKVCTQILGRLQNPHIPRRVLILLSSGVDNYSHLGVSHVDEDAEREGVAIFSLAEFAPSHSNEYSYRTHSEAKLRQASEETGGQEILAYKLADGVRPLLAAIQGQTILSIVPSQAADQKVHSLVVKSTQKGLSVSVPANILLP